MNKCNIDFAREAFDYISKRGNCLAIALDIKGFFDNIDHSILKEKWKKVMGVPTLPLDHFRVFKSLTKFSYVNRNTLLKFQGINLKNCQPKPKVLLEPTVENFKEIRGRNLIVTNKEERGIPQGSGMSAVLSNVYMIDFDAFIMGLAEAHDILYLRYCDDILIVCNQLNSERIIEKVYQEIENYGLEIQKKKEEKILFLKDPSGRLNSFNAKKLQEEGFSVPPSTHAGKFQKNLQYLGFEFNGKEAFIRSSSMSRYYRRMKARVRKTVNMAYGSKGKGQQIFKKRLYSRYTHLGKRNFITYALRSASPSYLNSDKQERLGMNSNSIRRQVARHFAILKRTVKLKSIERAAWKEKKLKE